VVTSLCKRVVVLDQGRKLAEGTPDEIVQNQAVREAYLGG
jgi:branched-chain amino acid transport system ATP-binding protein